MISQQKSQIIVGIALISSIAMFFVERIRQDSAYHLFADNRAIDGIPNLVNVMSNLPFVVVGLLGIRLCLTANISASLQKSRRPYLVFFLGVMLTGFGSGYYHLLPDNFTLLWDRMPLAVLSIALFCAVVSDCIHPKIGNRLLLPLIVLAISSASYWYYSELMGAGDLRPYILIQFLPMLLLPLILWLYDGNRHGCAFVWSVLGVYVLARIAESLDAEIYRYLRFISGHSIKHLLAGLSTWIVYTALKKRTA